MKNSSLDQCNNKVILVTGASRGIGAATAILAAQHGYDVAINYAGNLDAARTVADAIRLLGRKVHIIQADVSCEEDVIRMFDETTQTLGGIDALVNNAGILESQMRVENMSLERLQRVMAVNVIGSFLCAREAIKHMSTMRAGNDGKGGKCGKGGAIVNVSSAAARLGSPFEFVDYAASKGAIDSMTIGLAKEVTGDGIRVNAIRPGLIYTDIHQLAGEPGRVDRLKEAVPMKRGGTADEVAQTIIWLLSDAASYVTGSILDVTGGR